jgi:hypothetical protein
VDLSDAKLKYKTAFLTYPNINFWSLIPFSFEDFGCSIRRRPTPIEEDHSLFFIY